MHWKWTEVPSKLQKLADGLAATQEVLSLYVKCSCHRGSATAAREVPLPHWKCRHLTGYVTAAWEVLPPHVEVPTLNQKLMEIVTAASGSAVTSREVQLLQGKGCRCIER